jgi:hypothetical protein
MKHLWLRTTPPWMRSDFRDAHLRIVVMYTVCLSRRNRPIPVLPLLSTRQDLPRKCLRGRRGVRGSKQMGMDAGPMGMLRGTDLVRYTFDL